MMPGSGRSNTKKPRRESDFMPNEEFTAGDFTILQTLLQSRHSRNMTCEDVLDSLTGANNHTKEQWTSFLLRSIRTIEIDPPDEETTEPPVTRRVKRQPTTPGRPSSSHPPVVATRFQHPHASSSSNRIGRSISSNADSDMYTDPPTPRRTRNSVAIAINSEHSDQEQEETTSLSGIPDPRSRSLTPPIPVRVNNERLKFTDEDGQYIVKLGRQMFLQNPQFTRADLVRKATAQAPHHTLSSWQGYLCKNPHLEEDMRKALPVRTVPYVPYQAREDSDDSADESPAPERGGMDEDPRAVTQESEDVEPDLPVPDQPGDATEDEKNLGDAGSKYSGSDERVLARYIATHPEWHKRSVKQNIRLFYEKYQVRSEEGWRTYYSAHKRYIDSLAANMKLQKRSRDIKGKGKARHESVHSFDRSENGEDSNASSSLPRPNLESSCQLSESERRDQSNEITSSETQAIDILTDQSSRKRKGPDSGFDSDGSSVVQTVAFTPTAPIASGEPESTWTQRLIDRVPRPWTRS